MPRNKEPINFIEAKNQSHMTKEQRENRREQEGRMKPPADSIKPPKWLSKAARKEFRIMEANLQRLEETAECSFISNLDVPLLALWADAYTEYQTCCRMIEQAARLDNSNGLLTMQDSGVNLNPLLTQKKRLFEQMEKIGRQFGLSPAARLAITLPTGKEEHTKSKWDEFRVDAG